MLGGLGQYCEVWGQYWFDSTCGADSNRAVR